MSFIRRYWQGELVQTKSWTRELTFKQPFRLHGFGQPLPPGHYTVELAEVEVAVRDRTIRQIIRCMIPIPPNLLPPGVRTMFKNVDHTELERRHADDTMHFPASLRPAPLGDDDDYEPSPGPLAGPGEPWDRPTAH